MKQEKIKLPTIRWALVSHVFWMHTVICFWCSMASKMEGYCDRWDEKKKIGTSELTNLLVGKHFVRCKWVNTPKYNLDGLIQRYKPQLVAKRYSGIGGLLSWNNFSCGKAILSIAANFSWSSYQLNSDECIWCFTRSVHGFSTWIYSKSSRKKCPSKKALHELKQSFFFLNGNLSSHLRLGLTGSVKLC